MCIRNQPLPVRIISTDWEMVELLEQFASLLAWWKTEAEAEKIKVKLCVPERYSRLFVQQTVTIYWHIWLVRQVSIWTGTQVNSRLVSVCLFGFFLFVYKLRFNCVRIIQMINILAFIWFRQLWNFFDFLFSSCLIIVDWSFFTKNEDKINRLNALNICYKNLLTWGW